MFLSYSQSPFIEERMPDVTCRDANDAGDEDQVRESFVASVVVPHSASYALSSISCAGFGTRS